MAILDSKGRLFGKVNILDLGAALVMLLVAVAVFLVPGTSGSSVAQLGVQTKPVQVDTIVRGLTVSDPAALVQSLQESKKVNVIIRNQPYGELDVVGVKQLPRSVAVPQPDGTVISLPDPRPELDFTLDMMITLAGDAQMTDDGPVLGNNKVKVGTPLELEGQTFRFNAPVVGVRIQE
ncbi:MULTISPECIES: DUF4330 domain-containing protein [Thermoleptolyngbya]|jgi:hypothetical protein|uniref:DUF4330 domain-containing protein n=2 Tax=Thermoleptolyngbya TaxID=2303528 RepID=A0A6M8BBT9_9CYAN|nr:MULTISPECIES: DUF4330 domain-containing protein [Thermoleptolyngbya]WOB45248.1 DUF4330 domain-containing protein [Thermoleptolyngbya oregonensis NK1-22]MBF2085963.1 DUF4330 domain-containing protein [Thermoleptolyngbya sp. C42_A2020_037]MDG2617979.1 DUF4330 domain-containing protein [Thermoleptolyngbya sichuanensis XZ-Cy5]QKD82297.1 DUF4330 domain-containing protein [Thermoleptolyngbya sichuanensis A183]HIK40884.1 DUF4330 domain-containing protein [Thermoleptolyngbya sp. M55_K2018_002]